MKAKYFIAVATLLVWSAVSAADGVQWDGLSDGQKQVLSIYSEGW